MSTGNGHTKKFWKIQDAANEAGMSDKAFRRILAAHNIQLMLMNRKTFLTTQNFDLWLKLKRRGAVDEQKA